MNFGIDRFNIFKSQYTEPHTQRHIIPRCIEEDEDGDEDIVISPPPSLPSHRLDTRSVCLCILMSDNVVILLAKG